MAIPLSGSRVSLPSALLAPVRPAYNPTQFSRGGSPVSPAYNADNQDRRFPFDGSGNPMTYQGSTFSFDPEDRLTGIASPAFKARYDGDGLRAWKQGTGAATFFLNGR